MALAFCSFASARSSGVTQTPSPSLASRHTKPGLQPAASADPMVTVNASAEHITIADTLNKKILDTVVSHHWLVSKVGRPRLREPARSRLVSLVQYSPRSPILTLAARPASQK